MNFQGLKFQSGISPGGSIPLASLQDQREMRCEHTKYVHTHQRKAPLRGARVRYRARDALSALGGRDDQVDLGFGRGSENYRGVVRS